ncbi:MAG: hypothetical protein HFJ41_05480 [Clostridia bacterium]|nr:hypothetical protein [Clostridia bacterium]
MKTKKIGIVLTIRGENYIIGHLAKAKICPELDEFYRIQVNVEIEEIVFKLFIEEGTVGVIAGTLDDAYEVVEELKKIGYAISEMVHDGKTYVV